MTNYDLSPGKQLLADKTKLSTSMLQDKSGETCFCTTAAGLCGSCTTQLRKQKLFFFSALLVVNLSP